MRTFEYKELTKIIQSFRRIVLGKLYVWSDRKRTFTETREKLNYNLSERMEIIFGRFMVAADDDRKYSHFFFNGRDKIKNKRGQHDDIKTVEKRITGN